MAKLLLNALKLSPVVLAATFFAANGAFAAEDKFTSVNELAQVTSVDQLSDVQPSHWAYQSVKSLVERYACVAGYPDGTFKGNRSVTRYEFAALLNGCLDRINELIAMGTNVSEADKAAVKMLRDEFQGELATLRGKVDGLEFRTSELEGNQFSTTAKLKGKVEFITGGVFGPDTQVDGSGDLEDEITLGYRARLDITSSFTGKDKLRVRLHQRNNASYGTDRTGTNMSRIDVQGQSAGDDGDVFVDVEKLNYNFKPSKNIAASVWVVGAGMDDFLDAEKAKVQTTRFAKRNPFTHRTNSEDQGAGATIKFNKNTNFQLGYTTTGGNEVGSGKGIGGDYDLGAQLNFKVAGVDLGASYVHSSTSANSKGIDFSHKTGSSKAKLFANSAVESDSFGIQASTKLGKKTKVGAWYGLTNVDENVTNGGDATLQNWAIFASIKDFAKKGNVLGMTFGMPPKVTDHSTKANEDSDTSYLLDVTYRHQITDRLSLQPGVYAVFSPEHNSDNDTIYGVVLNTTFKF